MGVKVRVGVGCGRVNVNGTRFCPKHPLGEMAPWTVGLILNIALVDELLDVNHGMDHPVELQDTLLLIHPELRAGLTAHIPSVQLGKRMLPTAPNEGVPIIVLGLPSFVLPVLWLQKWQNAMLLSGETAIKQDHLPRLEIFELEPKLFQDLCVASHTARQPASPTVLT